MKKLNGKTIGIASVVLGLVVAVGALAADVAIISEGGTASLWRPAPGVPVVMPGYPESVTDKSEDVCVGIGYLLKADGSTSDVAILNSWGSNTPEGNAPEGHFNPYALYAAAAVLKWRFTPVGGGQANIKPMYTAASFAFTTNAQTDPKPLRERCVIADLAGFVAKARQAAYKRGNVKKAEMARDRVQAPPTITTRGQ
jgi:hypothetical protein